MGNNAFRVEWNNNLLIKPGVMCPWNFIKNLLVVLEHVGQDFKRNIYWESIKSAINTSSLYIVWEFSNRMMSYCPAILGFVYFKIFQLVI